MQILMNTFSKQTLCGCINVEERIVWWFSGIRHSPNFHWKSWIGLSTNCICDNIFAVMQANRTIWMWIVVIMLARDFGCNEIAHVLTPTVKTQSFRILFRSCNSVYQLNQFRIKSTKLTTFRREFHQMLQDFAYSRCHCAFGHVLCGHKAYG